jgi:hypothetical protein
MNTPLISMESLLTEHYTTNGEESPLELLAEAEVILGQDVATHKVFVVEGKESIKHTVEEPSHSPVSVVMVKLNRESDDLRQLHWLINVAKCR